MKNSLLLRTMRAAAVTAVVTALTIATVPAHAAADAPGAFVVDVAVGDNGGAVGTLSDTLITSNSYTVELTATGAGTCGLASPQVLIVDEAGGYGNPVSVQTSGACRLYNAQVTYTFTWTAILGATAQLQVVCVWTLGTKWCSPSHFEGRLPL